MSPATQQFEGRTIEDALGAAADELGPDVQLVGATKERHGGVLGFFAKERYVVTAQEPTSTATPPATFEEVLSSMVDRVDHREAAAAAPASSATAPAPAGVALDHRVRSAVVGDRPVIDLREGRAIRPAADPAPLAGVSPAQVAPASPERSAPASTPVRRGSGEPAWSPRALHQVGVPREILLRLPEPLPTTDLGWVSALAAAIDGVLPAEGERTRTYVVGRGLESVGDLLEAAVAGMTPGFLLVDGRRIQASSTELALAARELLR